MSIATGQVVVGNPSQRPCPAIKTRVCCHVDFAAALPLLKLKNVVSVALDPRSVPVVVKWKPLKPSQHFDLLTSRAMTAF
jgi:hypothetical protein